MKLNCLFTADRKSVPPPSRANGGNLRGSCPPETKGGRPLKTTQSVPPERKGTADAPNPKHSEEGALHKSVSVCTYVSIPASLPLACPVPSHSL